MDLHSKVQKYKEIQNLRKALENKAAELKEKLETPLMDEIMADMEAEGMKSLHFPDLGHVIVSQRSYYTITDKDAFVKANLNSIVTAAREGRPLAESMLAQWRPSREMLEDYLGHTGLTAQDCGVAKMDTPVLSIRK